MFERGAFFERKLKSQDGFLVRGQEERIFELGAIVERKLRWVFSQWDRKRGFPS